VNEKVLKELKQDRNLSSSKPHPVTQEYNTVQKIKQKRKQQHQQQVANETNNAEVTGGASESKNRKKTCASEAGDFFFDDCSAAAAPSAARGTSVNASGSGNIGNENNNGQKC
jgi:hypothetical protein